MVRESRFTSVGKMSISLKCTFWPETPKKLKRAETSMFYTGGLRHFGLCGRILREKTKVWTKSP